MKTNADAPVGADGKAFHLGTSENSLSPYCILVGDPERAQQIAVELFDNAELVGYRRGHESHTGYFQGIRMSVVTHLMGGVTASVLPEMVWSGMRRAIRVGTCATLLPDANIGDLLIWEGAGRFEAASDSWLPPGMPANSHWQVTSALVNAAEVQGVAHHVGNGASTVDFYQAQARSGQLGYIPPSLQQRHEWLMKTGTIGYEMEGAILFAFCRSHGHLYAIDRQPGLMCGMVTTVLANRSRAGGQLEHPDTTPAVRVALAAMMDLHRRYPLIAG